jgi:hypothetical protein
MVGEKIGTTKKTEYSEEFAELELAVNAKREAVTRLYESSTAYIKHMSTLL